MNSKFFLTLLISVFSISLWAQTQSGYLPFHEYLLKNHGNIQNNEGANARAVAFEKVGYNHFTNDASPPDWVESDSGVFDYYSVPDTSLWETGAIYYQFQDTINWVTTGIDTLNVSGYDQLNSLTHQSLVGGSWVNNYQLSYSYYTTAPVGYLNTLAIQTWNGTWIDSIQYTYTFDTIGRLTKTVVQTGGSLQNDSQYIYTYDGWNNTVLLTQIWNGSGWVNAFQQNNNFDANNNNYQSFVLAWNGSSWVNYALITRGYDLLNERVSYVSELWNGANGSYINNYQEAYAWELGNVTQFENYNWDTVTNAWVPNLLDTYSYDSYHDCIFEQDEAYTVDSFTSTDLYYYYYDNFIVSSVNEVKANQQQLSISPNPSTGNAVLSISTENAGPVAINVYDAEGNELKHLQTSVIAGNNQFAINLTNYAAGIYYVQMIDNTGNTGSLKFVKQ